MLRLTLCMLMLLPLISCKPMAEEDQRSVKDPDQRAGDTKANNLISEKSFEEWTGRSDLKIGWTFENLQ